MSLTQNLRESQSAAERSQTELQNLMARLIHLGARIKSLDHIRDQAAQNLVTKNEVIFKQIVSNYKNFAFNDIIFLYLLLQLSIEKLSLTVNQYQQWFALASKEIEQIRKELEELENELNCSDVTLQLKNELTNVKNKVMNRGSCNQFFFNRFFTLFYSFNSY